jgi:hypothetical protein
MRVKVLQMLTPDDLCDAWCCACRRRFPRTVAEIHLFTDERMDLGELCLACVEAGPEQIERGIRRRAEEARIEAEEMERAASETVDDCPSIEEYLVMERAIGKPRYVSFEEADRSFGYTD